MINGMNTLKSLVPATIPGNTRETPAGKPGDVTQKHDITPYLKTDGNEIQQPTVNLSSRTVTDLNSDSNNSDTSQSSPRHEAVAKLASKTETGQKVTKNRRLLEVDEYFVKIFNSLAKRPTFATAPHCQSVPEASKYIGQDKRLIQLNASSKQYTGSSERKNWEHMNNNPRGNYHASYANVPLGIEPETVQIGNQQLITLDTLQAFVDQDLEAKRENLEYYNFSFLVDFLHENSSIKYIVDIGCDDGKISLLMQNYLNEKGIQIKVIPVDIANEYDNVYCDDKPLPINIIPGQEIVGATPATTLFTAIHPFTGFEDKETELSREVTQGKTDYYITTLIKNNPGCFVLATEDPHASSPQHYIPPELVYTKHYHAFANSSLLKFWEDDERVTFLEEKAAEMNSENGNIHRLNQLLAKLPEQRGRYLASISRITRSSEWHIRNRPEEFWPDNIFNMYINEILLMATFKPFKIIKFESIQNEATTNELELRCWHVYRQDINASEVAGQAAKKTWFLN
ncbi:hypothetical protein [Endozoicomonas sp. 8E]|uniref:hypothetical protein n=1 Tax=Endozoicomonas sp. 8E TaxID=3035692 RepID=UPI002938EF15|nr:hypothetical protein [Endozoicomonas sp. 8E]WOG30037.1 hypothetical protein P6910_10395 [Endozoicomonas sp. 8E]